MSGLSEERGGGIPAGRVEGRTVELAYAEAADLLRAGKVLPARRHLIDAHQGGAPLGPRAAIMEEGLWDLDFRLRFQTLEELMSGLEADDDEMLEALLRRMERLLSARCEDLAAYIRILGV
ncbi:MAG TPA: hypothetical protein VE913_10390, partial [Longimicrobium sp.]|nr:hypothetical protein [Longimicrobium sp.]